MKILFLVIAFPDTTVGGGNIYTDLVQKIKELGNDVFVVAPLTGQGCVPGIKSENEIPVLRVKTGKLFNVNPILKGINNLLLPYQYRKAIEKFFKCQKIDWVVLSTPPITLGHLGSEIKKKYGCKSYLILRDIFPQNAKDLGLIKNKLLFDYFRSKEERMYRMADRIGCMSQGNIDFIRRQSPSVSAEKLLILPNWIKFRETLPVIDKIRVKAKYGFENKFVALFGGNFGRPQKIETVLELAASVSATHPNIIFLLIGNGTEKERIKSEIANKKLKNVILREFMPRDEYMELALACDIGLVNLSEKFTIPNIPSRTWAYWESGLPVLASIDKNTDLKEIIENEDAGLCSITGELEQYRKNLLYFYNHPEAVRRQGWNGRRAVEKNYCLDVIAREFLRQLQSSL